jgi:excisionase family DNA binding protein
MNSVLDKELLSVRDLQKLSDESEATWRKRLGRRELPYVKLGANVRIRRADFDRWIEARTVRERSVS